jgi:hypothetical protein
MMRVSCHTFVWPLIGNALLNFRERTIMTRVCEFFARPVGTAMGLAALVWAFVT